MYSCIKSLKITLLLLVNVYHAVDTDLQIIWWLIDVLLFLWKQCIILWRKEKKKKKYQQSIVTFSMLLAVSADGLYVFPMYS